MLRFEEMIPDSSFRKNMKEDAEPIQLSRGNILLNGTIKRNTEVMNECLFVVPWQQSHEY